MTIERRDPCSPVLQLGSALATARRQKKNGWIEIQDRGHLHGIQISQGSIANVVTDGNMLSGLTLHQQATHLFSLPRPRVHWIDDDTTAAFPALLDSSRIVLSGVVQRQDLFDPRLLVQRIPVETLHIPADLMNHLRKLPLCRRELEFLQNLRLPTPIPMILWKRGLPPAYAGALLVALNLMGLWKGHWEPGVLPRVSTATRILRKVQARVSDFELLSVDQKSDDQEQDRAFRRLCLELHPDRLSYLPAPELAMATRAFESVNAAYHRIRNSRRHRPVRSDNPMKIARIKLKKAAPDCWSEMLKKATESLSRGDHRQAKAFALKGLSLNPPPDARRELTALFTKVA